jgi:hypothetical protein
MQEDVVQADPGRLLDEIETMWSPFSNLLHVTEVEW